MGIKGGAMAQWRNGTMTQWRNGAMASGTGMESLIKRLPHQPFL